MKAVLILLAIISVTFAAPFQWQLCPGSNHFQPSDVTLVPYPALPGRYATLHITGTLDDSVDGGAWTNTLYQNDVAIQTTNGNTCSLIANCPCSCPAGHRTIEKSFIIPSTLPAGTLTGRLEASFDNRRISGGRLICITYTFQVL
eukprot:TRINITY_DN721_c0_g2_i1.p1 TRINITY_DN721_c0_g2~~TRINITY_DN721_c0_g2_i1.p1  ORF type:complete len:145 (-),score=17.93 TRINITY_DN721_c0_g2_i1:39-473(-)